MGVILSHYTSGNLLHKGKKNQLIQTCIRHLKLNISETELLIFSPHGFTSFFPISIVSTSFFPVVLILSSLSQPTSQVPENPAGSAFKMYPSLNIRYHLLCSTFARNTIIISHFDDCSRFIIGLPCCYLTPMSVLNTVAEGGFVKLRQLMQPLLFKTLQRVLILPRVSTCDMEERNRPDTVLK